VSALPPYWRCAHYPSAIENFFSTRRTCEWGCHTTTLEWHHSGVNPQPNLAVVQPTAQREPGANTAMAMPPRPVHLFWKSKKNNP